MHMHTVLYAFLPRSYRSEIGAWCNGGYNEDCENISGMFYKTVRSGGHEYNDVIQSIKSKITDSNGSIWC